MTREYELDGGRFQDLDAFFDEVSRVLIPGAAWGRNLDALVDVLRGGFGTPPTFVLVWKDADLSRERLSYPETVRQLERRLERCHPSNQEAVATELAAARAGEGPTVFDWLVSILRDADGLELRLE